MISNFQYLKFGPYFAQQDIEQPENRKIFLQSFDTLPQTIKDLLTSIETAEKIINLGNSFKLDDFDIESVAILARKIATGEIFVGNASEILVTETEIEPSKSKDLVSGLVLEILSPALDDIKKIQSVKFTQTGSNALPPKEKSRLSPVAPEPVAPRKVVPPQTTNPNVINLRNRQN